MAAINVPVSDEVKAALDRIAKAKKWTLATVVREALDMMIKKNVASWGVTHWSRWADHEFAGMPAVTDIYWDTERRLATMKRVDWAYLESVFPTVPVRRNWLANDGPVPPGLERIRERQLARANKDWLSADAIRRELAHLELVDHPNGTEWLSRPV